MDPKSDVIFPGAIVKGESITTGEYIPIITDRSPINISVSLQNISGNPSRTVENPSLSSVRTAINEIMWSDVTGATPANILFTIVILSPISQKISKNFRMKSQKVYQFFQCQEASRCVRF